MDASLTTPCRRMLPELLAPAGSPEALEAAVRAGADAVYLGSTAFNARMSAHNFDAKELADAVTFAHREGVRIYLTLNTLVWDRELIDAVRTAYEAASAGVDALIIADLGASALIHEALPALPLHASTQLSGHNARMGQVLAPFGFTRFVIARETTLDDLAAAVRNNPLEVEMFIHGALCVSHSGQCLFSSVVGGRSGNRGACAQPCRLPYACAGCASAGTCGKSDRSNNPKNGPRMDRRDFRTASDPRGNRDEIRGDRRGDRGDRRNSGNRYRDRSFPVRNGSQNGCRDTTPKKSADAAAYPLSLKDLSLAGHVPELIETGVSSLKIEGRMKSPGYVGGVTAIWRRLLDENRPATEDEWQTLQDLFSRGGFTDGYQTGHVDRHMMGVRSEQDKERTAAAEKAANTAKYPPHLPLDLTFTARRGEPVTVTAGAPLYRQGGIVDGMAAAKWAGDLKHSDVLNQDTSDSDTFSKYSPTSGLCTDSASVCNPAENPVNPDSGDSVPCPGSDTGTDTGTDTVTITVTGEIPAPVEAGDPSPALSADTVRKQMSRTGNTPYRVEEMRTALDDGVTYPLSGLNALRRQAIEALDAAREEALPATVRGFRQIHADEVTQRLEDRVKTVVSEGDLPVSENSTQRAACQAAHRTSRQMPRRTACRTARFCNSGQLTAAAFDYFNLAYLPLGQLDVKNPVLESRMNQIGVLMPPAIFDREADTVRRMLIRALESGVHHVMIGNLGHISLVREAIAAVQTTDSVRPPVRMHGDFRLNIANYPAALRVLGLGLDDLILSPELTLPRMRDIVRHLENADLSGENSGFRPAASAIVYGRLPLMLLEKCAIRAIYGDTDDPKGAAPVCRRECAENRAVLRDRMGVSFPILREFDHRNVVYNSLPLGMSDRADELARAGLASTHFLFTTESPAEVDHVICAYRDGQPLGCEVRRMMK